jgi:hypothetical protein
MHVASAMVGGPHTLTHRCLLLPMPAASPVHTAHAFTLRPNRTKRPYSIAFPTGSTHPHGHCRNVEGHERVGGQEEVEQARDLLPAVHVVREPGDVPGEGEEGWDAVALHVARQLGVTLQWHGTAAQQQGGEGSGWLQAFCEGGGLAARGAETGGRV